MKKKTKTIKAWVHIEYAEKHRPREVYLQKKKPKCPIMQIPFEECMYPCTITYKI